MPIALALGIMIVFGAAYFALPAFLSISYSSDDAAAATTTPPVATVIPTLPPLDTRAYDAKLLALAHVATSSLAYTNFINGTTTASSTPHKWPVRAVYPNAGGVLPFNRIVAYYGNFYSTQMGVLGEYPPAEMMQKLQAAIVQWQAADPSTPVIPALDYIAVVAQGSAGKDGMYRARMPDSQIDEALQLMSGVHGLVFLDVQVGLSNVQTEVPLLKKYLSMPNVELSLDPEFSMKDGVPPGHEIGTLDASDVNFAAQYLAGLVRDNNLPPKILVIHRFTEDMLTNYKKIKPLPEVQIVVDMDGWGSQAKKIGTYTNVIAAEPIQFTGFKLFYKNDLRPPSTGMLSPAQVLNLTPAPSYIQYQ
jgi:hypothetical protein